MRRLSDLPWVLLLSATVLAGCGDDDDPEAPPPDAGITAMILTVAGHTATITSEGELTGTLGPLTLGSMPVTAEFLGANGQPATNLDPARYTLELFIGDTLALDYEPGPGFSGTLTARAGGFFATTFRLRDESNDGIEISHATLLEIDTGIETIRLVFGDEVVEVAPGALPGVLPGVAVGNTPVTVQLLDGAGEPIAALTPPEFSLLVNSSDSRVVRYEPIDAFSGTLVGVGPGIASVAFRLFADSNDSTQLLHTLTVIVE